MVSRKKKHFWGWITAFIMSLGLILGIRTFWLESYVIHNTSMCNTLFPGDFILINKIPYGPRLPQTPLSLPYTDTYSDKIVLPYYRIRNSDTLHRNSIIAFNYPLDTLNPPDRRPLMIKRLIALPGDTISMRKKRVYVNAKKIELPGIQYAYLVKCSSSREFELLVHTYKLSEGARFGSESHYKLFLTPEQADSLRKHPFVKSLVLHYQGKTTDYMFNSLHNPKHWNNDWFDKIIVPGKNLTIAINYKNAGAYETIIRNYEKNSFEISKDSLILINGQATAYYTFRNDYFFVLDDNRDNANDSRYWGFLPEQFIMGKTNTILFSLNYDKSWWQIIRWNRLFKTFE